jgi:hypothetical protein
MDIELKELIRTATISGKLDSASRELIYKKALEKGISEAECNIYIQGFIAEIQNSKDHKSEGKRNYGLWLLIFGILDFIWLVKWSRHLDRDVGAFWFLISLISIVVGGYLIAGKRFVFGFTLFIISNIPLAFLGREIERSDYADVGMVVFWIFYFYSEIILFYLFKNWIFSDKNIQRIEKSFIPIIASPIMKILPSSLSSFLNKK